MPRDDLVSPPGECLTKTTVGEVCLQTWENQAMDLAFDDVHANESAKASAPACQKAPPPCPVPCVPSLF